MLTLWAALAAAGLGVPLAWIFERRRSHGRNLDGACAACGRPWGETPDAEPYLIHGRLVCEPCAEKAKRRLPWHLATIGAAAAVGTGIAAVSSGSPTIMALLPASSSLLMTAGAVQWMKLANRSAQRRIAAGEYEAFEAVHTLAASRPSRGP